MIACTAAGRQLGGRYPPRALISQFPAAASGTAASAAAANESSYRVSATPRQPATWSTVPADAGAPRRLPRRRRSWPARSRQREASGNDADHLVQRVADDRQAQAGRRRADRRSHRRPPAAPGRAAAAGAAGQCGADVVGAAEQHQGRPGRLRREHDPGREQRPYHALRAACPAAGHEGREQHQQRVGQCEQM